MCSMRRTTSASVTCPPFQVHRPTGVVEMADRVQEPRVEVLLDGVDDAVDHAHLGMDPGCRVAELGEPAGTGAVPLCAPEVERVAGGRDDAAPGDLIGGDDVGLDELCDRGVLGVDDQAAADDDV